MFIRSGGTAHLQWGPLRSGIAHKLRAGGVAINGAGPFRPGSVPFGGFERSGIGRASIVDTILEMTEEKANGPNEALARPGDASAQNQARKCEAA